MITSHGSKRRDWVGLIREQTREAPEDEGFRLLVVIHFGHQHRKCGGRLKRTPDGKQRLVDRGLFRE